MKNYQVAAGFNFQTFLAACAAASLPLEKTTDADPAVPVGWASLDADGLTVHADGLTDAQWAQIDAAVAAQSQ